MMRYFWLLILISLLGCSGQTVKKQTAESAKLPLDGIWEGGFDINRRGPYDFQAIHINGHSTAVSYKAKALCSGNISGEDGDYFALYNLYALDGAPFDEARITGTLKDGVIESYFKTLNGGDVGKLTMTYNPIFENDSSLELLEGQWSFTDRDGLVIDAQISNGVLAGIDSDRCTYSGKFAIINSDFNAYGVRIHIANCHSVDGEYEGLAYMDSETIDGENVSIIRMDFVNPLYGFHFDLQEVEGQLRTKEI